MAVFAARSAARREAGHRFRPRSLQVLDLVGFRDGEAFGAQRAAAGAVAVDMAGFADPDLFGAQSSLAPGTVGLAAFADPDRFGEVRLWARHAPGRYAGARGARGHAAPRPRTGVGGP